MSYKALAAIPSVCSEAMNNSHTCGQPDTHKNKELCNAEAHTGGRGRDGVVQYTFTQLCKYWQRCSVTYKNQLFLFLSFLYVFISAMHVWGMGAGGSDVIFAPSARAPLLATTTDCMVWSSFPRICLCVSLCSSGISGEALELELASHRISLHLLHFLCVLVIHPSPPSCALPSLSPSFTVIHCYPLVIMY